MKRWIALAVLFGIGLTCLVLTDREYRSQVHTENSRLLTQASAEFQNIMETAVTLRLPAVRDLRAFMLVPATLPDEDLFSRYAATVLTSYPTIRALQYVDPDHIIRYVYPLATNEPAVGLDLMSLPEVVPFVEKAIRERRMTVSDPILTVQGSIAIVARDPLFTETDFFGMVQGVFDIDALLKEAIGAIDPRFAVQVVDATGSRFWGAEDLLGDTHTVVVPVGDNAWTVTVGWQTAEPRPARFILWLIWAGGGALLLSLLLIVEQTWTRTERLHLAVAKRTEALAKREEKFRKAFYTSSDSININRLEDGLYVAVNRGFSQIIGYTEADVVGKTSTELEIWADPRDSQRLAAGLRQNGEVSNLEAQFRKKDGGLIVGLMSATVIDLDDVPHIISITRDITERKQAEAELQESNDRLKIILEHNPIAIWDWNIKTDIWFATAKYYTMLGYEPEIGYPDRAVWLNRVHPDDRESVRRKIFAVLKHTNVQYQYDARMLHADGSYRWHTVIGHVIARDDDGKAARMLGVRIDINERKQAEKKISELNARLVNVFESMTDAFVSLDKNWIYTYANEHAAQIFGRTPDQMVGKHIWTEFPEGVGQPFYKAYYQAVETNQAITLEEYYPPYDKWFENRIYPSSDGLAIFFTDITERKQAEEALRSQQQFIAAIAETSPAMIYVYDMETQNNVYINSGIERMLNYSAQEVQALGADLLPTLIHPQDMATVIAIQAKIMAAADTDTLELEYRMQHQNGEWRMFRSYERPFIRNADGSLKQKVGVAIDISERRQAELALKRNEHVLRLFVEHSPAAVAMFDREMKYVVVSRRYAKDYGLGEQQLVGRSHYDVFPEITERLKEIHQRCLAGAVEKCDQDPFPRMHGGVDWVQWEVRPWFETTGEIGGIILFSEVITERVQAEEDIRRRADELAALNALGRKVGLTLSLDEVISAALQGMQKAVNSDLAYFFLRDGERLLLKGIVPAEAKVRLGDVPEHRVGECICGLAVSEKKPLYSRDIFKDLRCTWEECKKAGMRSFAALPLLSGGEVIGVIGLASNQERDFAARAGFLETLTTTVAVSLSNALLHERTRRRLGDLTTIHRAAQQLQVMQPPQALSQTLIHLLETELSYEYGAILLVDEESDTLFPFALSHQGKDLEFVEQDKAYVRSKGVRVGKGITGWVAQSGESVRLGDVRQDPRYTSMRSDIRSELCVPLRSGEQIIGVVNTETTAMNAYSETDQRMLETIAAQIAVAIQNARLLEQIQRYTAELEHRVNERTAQLQSANKDLESFSYSVSHDLRAPLRAISGFSEIIARRHRADLSPEGQHYVDNIVQASARMGQLIDDLLTYSRLGRAGVRREPISLAVLMQETRSNLGSLVSASHGILNLAQGLPTVMGDRTLLSQIFTNLLENGLKYHQPDVAPQVSVDFRVDAAEDQHVIVSVTDNGIGIPPEYQDKIFNIFQRLHSEEEYPGTGVGLATVKKAVDLLGGKVWVASQVGKGSTFWVKLPKG